MCKLNLGKNNFVIKSPKWKCIHRKQTWPFVQPNRIKFGGRRKNVFMPFKIRHLPAADKKTEGLWKLRKKEDEQDEGASLVKSWQAQVNEPQKSNEMYEICTENLLNPMQATDKRRLWNTRARQIEKMTLTEINGTFKWNCRLVNYFWN